MKVKKVLQMKFKKDSFLDKPTIKKIPEMIENASSVALLEEGEYSDGDTYVVVEIKVKK